MSNSESNFNFSHSDGCKCLCDQWNNATTTTTTTFQEEDFTSFNTMQKIDFLTKLYQETNLPLDMLKVMSEIYKLPSYNISEVRKDLAVKDRLIRLIYKS